MNSPWLDRAWWQSWLLHPNLAVAILATGCVLLMVEFHRPGRVVFGALGTLLALAAAWGLAQQPLHSTAVTMVAMALLLLLLETRIDSYGVIPLLGVILLTTGLLRLTRPPAEAIFWGTALIAGCGVGGGAFRLAWFARRARQRKYALGLPAD